MNYRLKLQKSEKGQAMVQFAGTAVVLFLLIFGIFNFGMAIYSYSMVTYAANDAVRWASVRGATYTPPNSTTPTPASSTDVLNHVVAAMPTLNTSEAIATCTTDSTSGALEVCTQWSQVAGVNNNSPGMIVQVQVKYNFPLSIPLMSTITLPLTATSQMTISQ
jgi:Flp pilus assembly protein TadG